MREENLFDYFQASDDIKNLTLSFLNFKEICQTTTHLDAEWNKLCNKKLMNHYNNNDSNKLSLNLLFSNYIINDIDKTGYARVGYFGYAKEHNKILCLRNYDSELVRIGMVRYSDEYDSKSKFEIALYNSSAPINLLNNLNDYNMQEQEMKLAYFYNKNMIYGLPRVRKFDRKTLFNQLTKDYSGGNHNRIFVDVKPLYIYLTDDKWYRKYGNHTINKNSNISFSNFFQRFFCVISESTFKQRDWKMGELYDGTRKKDNGHKIFYDERELNYSLHNSFGQACIYINITEEFDQFQKELRKIWIKNGKNENDENSWDNREYFMSKVTRDGKNDIYFKYYAYLDNTQEIAPYGTHTNNTFDKTHNNDE